MTSWDDVKLDVNLVEYQVLVNLDADGTPLDSHGERMIEVEPGKWQEALLVDVLAYLGAHKP